MDWHGTVKGNEILEPLEAAGELPRAARERFGVAGGVYRETTAKCDLYCPMCVREIYKQPKADMSDEVFERLVGAKAAQEADLRGGRP